MNLDDVRRALPYRRTRTMTAERMRWYADGLETAAEASGHYVNAGPNIHTDDDLARANGLPGRVADGMITTNWLYQVMVDLIGVGFLGRGRIATKYIRPVYENDRITTVVDAVEVATVDGVPAAVFTIRCQKADGQPCTVGTASMPLTGS
jgi:3-hydroxybutyryl-CoA dehydratase